MANLINLIKADFTKLMSASFLYKLFPPIALVVAFLSPQAFAFILILMVYLFGYGLLSYDENFHTQNYYAWLPIKRSEYVVGKYLFSLALSVASIGVCYLVSLLGRTMIGAQQMAEGPLFLYFLWGFVISNVYLAIQYPLTLFLGGVRGRVAAMILYLSLFMFSFNPELFGPILAFLQGSSLLLLAVISVILYCISCIISIAIYEKKEL